MYIQEALILKLLKIQNSCFVFINNSDQETPVSFPIIFLKESLVTIGWFQMESPNCKRLDDCPLYINYQAKNIAYRAAVRNKTRTKSVSVPHVVLLIIELRLLLRIARTAQICMSNKRNLLNPVWSHWAKNTKKNKRLYYFGSVLFIVSSEKADDFNLPQPTTTFK